MITDSQVCVNSYFNLFYNSFELFPCVLLNTFNSICHFLVKCNPHFSFFFDTPIPSPLIISFLLRIYLYHITSRLITRYNLLYIFNIVITLPLSGKTLTGVHNFHQTILGFFLFIMQIQKLTPYSCIYLPIHIIYHYYFLTPIQETAVM